MEMICPKAKECEFKCLDKKPHEYSDTCKKECKLLGGTCIEYKPEPEPTCKMGYHYRTSTCKTCSWFMLCEFEQPEPTFRLVKLPPKETIKLEHNFVLNDIPETIQTLLMATGAAEVYASASEVDIDKLAEKIWRAVPEYTGHYNLTKIKQAIQDYLKE